MESHRPENEKRKEQRYELAQPIEARLHVIPPDELFKIEIVNISQTGLCATIQSNIPEKAKLYVLINGTRFQVEQAWSFEEVGQEIRYKYGFYLVEDSINLIDIFAKANLLASDVIEETRSEVELFVEEMEKSLKK